MTFTLEGSAMTDRVAVHDHLAERLSLPVYYGRNLDALYDVLTGMGGETLIVVKDAELISGQLGRYGESLLATLRDAAEENPKLTVTLK